MRERERERERGRERLRGRQEKEIKLGNYGKPVAFTVGRNETA